MNDESTFDAYRASPSAEALVGLLRASQDRVYNLCYRVLRQTQDAEDASQKVFLRVIDVMPKLTDAAHYRRILCRIALQVALDELRARKARALYEMRKARMNDKKVRGGAEPDLEPLYQHLTRLDDPDRSVLVEHYFEGRPLEEIARGEGCSKVAIWKRLEKAKGALRLSLGGAGLSALALGLPGLLEAMPFTPAPGEPLGEAVRAKAAACAGGAGKGVFLLTGGLAMQGKAVSLGVAILLLAVGVAGSAAFIRRNAGHALVIGAETPSVTHAPGAAITSFSALAAPSGPTPGSPRARKAPGPYPYRVELPPPAWPKAKRDTWKTLHETMLDPVSALNGQNVAEFVATFSRRTGVVFAIGCALPTAAAGTHVFAVGEPWSAWDALTGFVTGSRLDFALRDDGTVYIDDRRRVALEKERPSEAEGLRDEMGLVARSLDKGWNGSDYDDRVSPEALGRKVALSATASSFKEAFERLAEASGVAIHLGGMSEEERAKVYGPFAGGTLHVGAEESLESELRRLCFMAGLDYYLSGEGSVIVGQSGPAGEGRAEREAHEAELQKLDSLRLSGGEPLSIPDFAASLEKATGIRVIPSQEAWESDAEVGGRPVSARAALDDLSRRSGLRWALRYGRVWILE
jgi:RNA polymerase sigma factor (sigma-70 family)